MKRLPSAGVADWLACLGIEGIYMDNERGGDLALWHACAR